MKQYYPDRKCCICGKTFSPNSPNQKCCSDKCSEVNRRNIATAYRHKHPCTYTHRKKKMSELARINELARSEGKTYGMYVMREEMKD